DTNSQTFSIWIQTSLFIINTLTNTHTHVYSGCLRSTVTNITLSLTHTHTHTHTHTGYTSEGPSHHRTTAFQQRRHLCYSKLKRGKHFTVGEKYVCFHFKHAQPRYSSLTAGMLEYTLPSAGMRLHGIMNKHI